MSRVSVNWGQANYEWAMSLRGTMSRREAEAETGIPNQTIGQWWNGDTPRHLRPAPTGGGTGPRVTHCARGHKLTAANTIAASARPNHRRCKKCKAETDRRRGYRKRGLFHPKWNPDPLLAPFHHLWFPAGDVVDFIRARYSDEDVRSQFADKNSVDSKRFYELVNGRRDWIRYDTAESLLGVLGIVSSELGVDAVYSTVMPTRRDGGQQAAA